MKNLEEHLSSDPIGRVHLDSLELYPNTHMKKDTLIHLMPIGEMEVGEKKTVYEGTPDPTL